MQLSAVRTVAVDSVQKKAKLQPFGRNFLFSIDRLAIASSSHIFAIDVGQTSRLVGPNVSGNGGARFPFLHNVGERRGCALGGDSKTA